MCEQYILCLSRSECWLCVNNTIYVLVDKSVEICVNNTIYV